MSRYPILAICPQLPAAPYTICIVNSSLQNSLDDIRPQMKPSQPRSYERYQQIAILTIKPNRNTTDGLLTVSRSTTVILCQRRKENSFETSGRMSVQ